MKEENYQVEHYQDILLLLLCQNPNYKYYLGQYDACPKNEFLQDAIIKILHKNLVQSVVHKHWVSKPRTILGGG